MNCRKARTLLVALADGELRGHDLVRVQEHLAACPGCAQELAELAGDAELLRAEPRPEVPPWLAARVLALADRGRARHVPSLAATVAAMTVVSAAGLWLGIAIGRAIVSPLPDAGTKSALVQSGFVASGPLNGSAR